MNQNQPGGGQQPSTTTSWGTKVGYIGTGVLIGLVIYPFVRKAVAKVQPKLDKVFDDLTGKAEDLAERTSDILARAKTHLRATEEEEHDHDQDCDHDHDHRPSRAKASKKA
jgi:ABC-type Zn2+ transport system substrate-binding protein/surface adhesin